jgi:hypothetical protein
MDQHVLTCTSENKYIAPFSVLNSKYDCSGKEDEYSPASFQSTQKVSFQLICDGFQEMNYVQIGDRNESDETECDHWPCNNTYTHCNEIWNCPQGIDGVNCYPSVCVRHLNTCAFRRSPTI